jgi:flavin-dependent dehydrogenase
MEKHDVAIIGGGLAGLSTAKFLAEAGIDFVLLEEHHDFYMKACGEGIGIRIGDYRLSDLYGSKRGIEREVRGICAQTKYGDITIPAPLLIINKREMEKEFADQAIKRGANIRMNERVKVIEKHENFIIKPQNIEAKILVGADGVFSIVRKFTGQSTPKCAIGVSGISQNIDRDMDYCYMILNNDLIKYGYAWFFPKKDTWNIGVGSLHQQHFKEAFDNFKKKYVVDSWKGGCGPFSKPLKLSNKNIFLVGDAGAQVRSIAGAGNFTSIISGKILADTIIKFSKKNFREIDSKEYTKTWNGAIGKICRREYYLTYVLKQIMKNDRLLYFSISKLAKLAPKHFKSQY